MNQWESIEKKEESRFCRRTMLKRIDAERLLQTNIFIFIYIYISFLRINYSN